MTTPDYTKGLFEFWKAQGEALMHAGQTANKMFADGMQALASAGAPMVPGTAPDLASGAADLARAGNAVMELWSAALAMSATLATTLPAAGRGDETVEATWRKIIDPRSWLGGAGEMDEVLGRMAEGPRFADLWQIERLYARVAQGWMTVRRRGLEHNAIVLKAWLEAARRFSDEVAPKLRAGGQAPDAKATLTLWTDTANRVLLETQRSEPYLQTQAATIRASTELRLAQQELVEHFGKQYGFPTRTELDDVHRTLTELRRELRALRRAQAVAPPAAVAPAAALPSPRPRRSATNKQGAR
jgi:hypothetical protein